MMIAINTIKKFKRLIELRARSLLYVIKVYDKIATPYTFSSSIKGEEITLTKVSSTSKYNFSVIFFFL